MNRRSLLLPALACLLALEYGMARAGAQEQIRLVNVDGVGDLFRTDQTMHIDLSLKATGEDGKPMTFAFKMDERTKETTSVLAVDGKGHGSTIRRVYTFYRTDETGPDGPKKRVNSLEGKTVTLKRIGKKTTIASTSGKLAPADRDSLQDESPAPDLLPSKPVAVGDTWDVDAAAIPKQFGFGKGSGNMQGTLAELLSYHGHRCARLHYILDVAGQPTGQTFTVHLKLEGDALYALDLKRLAAFNLEGPLTASGTVPGAEVKGDGNAKMGMAMDWVRVAGKPVATPPALSKPSGAGSRLGGTLKEGRATHSAVPASTLASLQGSGSRTP